MATRLTGQSTKELKRQLRKVDRVRAETAERLYDNRQTSDGQKHIYRRAVANERAGMQERTYVIYEL